MKMTMDALAVVVDAVMPTTLMMEKKDDLVELKVVPDNSM